ncbi:TolC family protein [Legionella longbeachae]|uniref:Putative outer membrane efflux protein n=1 Tax=Legionella longbeachae serogroup 1 (strain NSW150) TaxID=661367 RepID=D3HQ72_LEGLN|nr:TolC family protein [Legionella longbeachae]VEE01557.1 outer membrane efflux protein [Legionella oakridgensis]HBD7396319.1 TolC family protein [Legionella pneumophila]ARB92093.1 transporter [Legionella longbeachae]ARM34726.1 transporter [Legionella longbeachae]EEZ95855.1 outer membrane efflux protein [Legionella longbeachae D-4968]
MIRTIGLLILSLILSSCAQHAQKPLLVVPDQWAAKNKHYMNSNENLTCFAWWKQFNDPNLNSFIDRGLIYNNDINIAVAHIEAAQGELKRVQLNWIPDVTGNAGYSSFPYLGFPGVLLTAVPTYTLNIFKQIKEQQKARYELKATKSMYHGIRLAVISQIASNYFNYLSQVEQLSLLHALEQDLSKLITISKTLYQGGLYARTEVDLALTEFSLIQAKERVVQQNIVVRENALHYLLDENPDRVFVSRRFRDLNGQKMIIGALPINIIENRPDMEQAKQELFAANAGIGLSFAPLLPAINLAMARGEIAKVENGGQLGQAIHFNQAIVEVPFLKASTYGQLIKAKGLDKASYYRYSETLRKVLRDITNDLSAHELYTRRLNDVLKAERELSKAYRLNQTLYQRGIISHLSLIKEKVRLDELAIEVNQHKLEQLITVVNLYQDLAAGYNYIPK